jgi:Protein of unknown function (DUF3127).
MALEIIGRLWQKLPTQSGQSTKGAWVKQEFVVETQENFPRKICFSLWGADKVGELEGYHEGETLKVSFNLESRSYNERWYTDARAWRMERLGDNVPAQNAMPSGPEVPASPLSYSDPEYLNSGGTAVDDLPF